MLCTLGVWESGIRGNSRKVEREIRGNVMEQVDSQGKLEMGMEDPKEKRKVEEMGGDLTHPGKVIRDTAVLVGR